MNDQLKLDIANCGVELVNNISILNRETLSSKFGVTETIWSEITESLARYFCAPLESGMVTPPKSINVGRISLDDDRESGENPEVRIYKRDTNEKLGHNEYGVEMALYSSKSEPIDLTLLFDVWATDEKVESARYSLIEVI
jgi:hypothetical protein